MGIVSFTAKPGFHTGRKPCSEEPLPARLFLDNGGTSPFSMIEHQGPILRNGTDHHFIHGPHCFPGSAPCPGQARSERTLLKVMRPIR